MEPESPETMSAAEFYSALDNIRAHVLASHLILMEELRDIKEEVYDPEKEVRRFLDYHREAIGSLHKADQAARESLQAVLARRSLGETFP